ncbi:3-deoxy-D-manno-octulosonic acid transferase [Rhabdochlamydiaceae symbiont of Dictyostelium giganteum]|uniref:3-deoxy-D-manno-octulosonic acid transferase n=1 Tax=Rhabdochlamydiaceae symbiont of Dictyostelium giganteum TaxID=3342349 RepID=UPI00384DDDEC
MFNLLYNTLLLVMLCLFLPKWLFDMLQSRKHHRSFLEKLGVKITPFRPSSEGPRVWIHSISVGETRSVAPLAHKIQKEIPSASLMVSTVTETGQAEAKRSIPHAQHYFYLPFDFSWNIKRVLKHLKPDILILVESDFWLNLIRLSPKVVLVNGDISEKSFSRFKKVPFFTKRLFRNIDLLCVQSAQFAHRFEELGIDPHRIAVTGNLKFDHEIPLIDLMDWRLKLGIHEEDTIITLGSTHEGEEESLLHALMPLLEKYPCLKILLAPRHPERFKKVAELMSKKKIPFTLFSQRDKEKESSRIVLIDAMGILPACYKVSHLAIVGGSFIPHVGGHNIFEPAMMGTPVLFGPYMHGQQDLVDLVLGQEGRAPAGAQVMLDDVSSTVEEMLLNPPISMRESGLLLGEEARGATERTWRLIKRFLV